MSDKRPILVIGASGLIGGRVVEMLAFRFAPEGAIQQLISFVQFPYQSAN